MKVISNNNLFYAFSKDVKPVAEIESGATVQFVTKDCFTDQICKPDDFKALNWENVNPATGPVYILNAAKGDILKVEILQINISNKGVMCVAPNAGVLGDQITDAVARVMDIQDGYVIFNDKIKVPLNKMIGVIGVAPSDGAIPNGTPGQHGGNMDNKKICEGATLYLPIFHDGALFGLGDLHGAMGDGEVCVTGLEVGGAVTVKLTVIKGTTIKHPMLEDAVNIYTIASAKTLEDATKISTDQMAKFLMKKTQLSLSDTTMLMSVAGNIEIAQVVDPLMTVRFAIPKTIVRSYFINIF